MVTTDLPRRSCWLAPALRCDCVCVCFRPQKHGSVQPDRGHVPAGELTQNLSRTAPPSSNDPSSPQYKTDLIPILKVPTRTVLPNFVYVVPDESGPEARTVYLELTPPPEIMYKTSPGSSQQMNVLGIVVFSATMGEPLPQQHLLPIMLCTTAHVQTLSFNL